MAKVSNRMAALYAPRAISINSVMPQKSNTERGVEGPLLRLYQRYLKLSIRPCTPQLDEHERVGKRLAFVYVSRHSNAPFLMTQPKRPLPTFRINSAEELRIIYIF